MSHSATNGIENCKCYICVLFQWYKKIHYRKGNSLDLQPIYCHSVEGDIRILLYKISIFYHLLPSQSYFCSYWKLSIAVVVKDLVPSKSRSLNSVLDSKFPSYSALDGPQLWNRIYPVPHAKSGRSLVDRTFCNLVPSSPGHFLAIWTTILTIYFWICNDSSLSRGPPSQHQFLCHSVTSQRALVK